MNKNERNVLRCFNRMETPQDFISSFGRELFISTLIGYVQQLLKYGFIKIKGDEDLKVAEEDFKRDIKNFIDSKFENLIYYNVMKSSLIIVLKYLK